jgi:hypothetical protein
MQSIFSDFSGIKLEINNRRKTGKLKNLWKLNILLNSQWTKEEFTRESRIYLEMNENLWHKVKAVLGGRATVMNTSIKKQEIFQQPNLQCKELENKLNPKLV